MKTFFAVYLGNENGMKQWEKLDKATQQERENSGMKAWMNWGTKHKNEIVDMGCPIGKTKLINTKGISDTKNEITGYTIVRAESHEAAAKLFLNHPHFSIFPGDRVEIMECLPLPEM